MSIKEHKKKRQRDRDQETERKSVQVGDHNLWQEIRQTSSTQSQFNFIGPHCLGQLEKYLLNIR